jgi:hypothetical protein
VGPTTRHASHPELATRQFASLPRAASGACHVLSPKLGHAKLETLNLASEPETLKTLCLLKGLARLDSRFPCVVRVRAARGCSEAPARLDSRLPPLSKFTL